MFFHHQDRRRAASVAVALLVLLGVVGVSAFGALPALSWRTLLRDDVALSVSWNCAGATAEQGERSVVIPIEQMLSTLGAYQMSSSAIAGNVTLTARLPSDVDRSLVRARLGSAGRCAVAPAHAPSVSFVRASGGVSSDLIRVLFGLSFALAVPSLLTPLMRPPPRAPSVGRRSPVRRCLGHLLDRTLDGFQDALAWALRHRGRLVAALMLVVSALTLAALGRGAEGTAPPTLRSSTSDWRVVVYGEDLNTLGGVARRIADEVRRLPSVRRAVVSADVDEIRHIDGERAASIEVSASETGSTLGSALQRVVDATVVPAGHRVSIIGEIAEAHRLGVALRRLVIAGALALLLIAALRHGNWAAPLAIGAGMPLVLLGTAPAFVVTPERLAPWITLGASLPLLMLARQAGALFAVAEGRERDGSPLYVAVIDSAGVALRPLLIVSMSQALALAPFAWLGDANVAAAAIAAIGGLGMTVIAVAFVAPVAYEVVRRAEWRWRTSRLRRHLSREAGT